jgi:uncharacterized protein YndB with AHSA1/START domain
MSDRIEKQIELAATPARVWRALSNAHEFGTWFGAKLEGDFVPGATIRGLLTFAGLEHVTLEMVIERVEKERLLAFRWHPFAIDPAVDYSHEATTLVELRLEPSATGTRLVVTESGFDKLPPERRAKAFEMNAGGWATQLEKIARHVA